MSDAPIRAHYRSIAPKRVHYHEVDMQNIVQKGPPIGVEEGPPFRII